MLIRNEQTAAKQAVEQGNMKDVSFRPLQWGDIGLLQQIFSDHSGFTGLNLSNLSRKSDRHFAIVAVRDHQIVGLMTANAKGNDTNQKLEIKPPFFHNVLLNISKREVRALSDLPAETSLLHEFKLAMIDHARKNNKALTTLVYGFSTETPIYIASKPLEPANNSTTEPSFTQTVK